MFEYAPAPESRDIARLKPSYQIFVDGAFRDGAGDAVKTINPADESPLAEVAEAGPSDVQDAVARRLPLRHIGDPEEIGRAVAFLASDDASYVTGNLLTLDGGSWHTRRRPSGLRSPTVLEEDLPDGTPPNRTGRGRREANWDRGSDQHLIGKAELSPDHRLGGLVEQREGCPQAQGPGGDEGGFRAGKPTADDTDAAHAVTASGVASNCKASPVTRMRRHSSSMTAPMEW